MTRLSLIALLALLAGCGPETINNGSGSGTGAGSGLPSGEYQGTGSSSERAPSSTNQPPVKQDKPTASP